MNKDDWEKIGTFDVDAGVCWIGDPCYIIHSDEPRESLGKTWSDFCGTLEEKGINGKGFVQFGHTLEPDADGLGLCITTGYGDGTYPVYVKRSGSRIMEIKIVFDYPDDDMNDDW